MTKGLLDRITPVNYLAVRFTLAFIVGALIFWKRLVAMSGRQWFYGFSLGFMFSLGQALNTVGLQYVDASVSGFITVMYIVFTPILVWILFRLKIDPFDWVAVVLAVVGLGILSLTGGNLEFGLGELLTLGSALAFAFHIVMMSRWAVRADPVSLSIVQMGVLGAVFSVISAGQGFQLPVLVTDWMALFYMAVVAGLMAMIIQTWAQQRLSATSVALTFSLEPVFASVFAIMIWGEPLTSSLIWGGLLILLAMQVSALGSKYLERRRAMTYAESVLPETSAGLSQAFQDVFEGGLPTAVIEDEDLLEGDAIAQSMEGMDNPAPDRSIMSPPSA
ncbi:hypothetical protein BM477_05345 [Boudabousia marimammalium]|uniref:EamA domain-containing protein n=2 Tax=Boudabousia marimammalium TaxID=156892 RepID=A0A1Q5PM62_9ACTO|nr:hypothetical protein BM477_05345 [Boudabousia marimammalium]